MHRFSAAAAVLLASAAFAPAAWAQKEAIVMTYELKIAPGVCKWSGVADPGKIDTAIAAQEQALGISAADKQNFMKQAEDDLKSDPANCAVDGMLRAMYDASTK